jgi:uncharacterized protein
MKLTFLGGADEVGASSTLIEIAGKKLLVDVGIRISPKTVRGISGDQLPDLQLITDAGGPDYILVTHAHTDHTGALPIVMEHYRDVPVLATAPTIALTRTLQYDAQRIMSTKQEQEGELPLFDEVSMQRLLDAFQVVPLRQTFSLGDGLQVTYYASGHIMGAAMLLIESEEGILLMSGDLSLGSQRAVVEAEIPRAKADFMVMESTYGNRLHAARPAEEKRLIETLQRVTERGGKAIIPAFALGRAQEVIQILHAFRDELDVPVWVDGMVRAVCETYHIHQEFLPKRTQRSIKDDDHLFFRKNVKPIKSPHQREQVAFAEGPAVIVSSSGMLTGGPSVGYFKWLAEDERNAVFLTGYQDEEAPGRRIQHMLDQHEAGKAVTFDVEGSKLQLRCELGKYSLSAHADSSELLSIAKSVGANQIALVHGDENARHQLAASLQERNTRVHLPASGTTIEANFGKRTWKVGVKQGNEIAPLDPVKLWESLKLEQGSFLSARELAQAWWGDSARFQEVIPVLEADGVYFAQSWKRKDTFQVRPAEKVERSRWQRTIMKRFSLMNQMIVLRDVNDKARIGVVQEVRPDSFRAVVARARGQQYPADALVYPIADWETFPGKLEEKGYMAQISDMLRQAEAWGDVLMPFDKRRALDLAGEAVLPDDLLPAELPEGVAPELAKLAIVLQLAKDGAELTEDGVLPKHAKMTEPMEMNLARTTILELFGEEAGIRKVGMDLNTGQMTLSFNFPTVAEEKYGDLIERAEALTNWQVNISPDVNQNALGMAVHELLPPEATLRKGPSFFLGQGQVKIEVEGDIDTTELTKQYHEKTGFELLVNDNGNTKTDSGETTAQSASATPGASNNQMEINAAYDLIRSQLNEHGLQKAGLKQGRIVLSFISPQVGLRHYDKIEELARQTGYELTVHPHPNQNAITQEAQKMMVQNGVRIVKGPSIYVDRNTVGIKTDTELTDEQRTQLEERFEHITGFKLEFSS